MKNSVDFRVDLISVLSVLKIKSKLRLPHPSDYFFGNDGFAVAICWFKNSSNSWLKKHKIALQKYAKSMQL